MLGLDKEEALAPERREASKARPPNGNSARRPPRRTCSRLPKGLASRSLEGRVVRVLATFFGKMTMAPAVSSSVAAPVTTALSALSIGQRWAGDQRKSCDHKGGQTGAQCWHYQRSKVHPNQTLFAVKVPYAGGERMPFTSVRVATHHAAPRLAGG